MSPARRKVIDAATADWGLGGSQGNRHGWQDAMPATGAARRSLIADSLRYRVFSNVPPGEVVRSDLADGKVFPQHPLTVPANSHVRILPAARGDDLRLSAV